MSKQGSVTAATHREVKRENVRLKARISELEANWKKAIEDCQAKTRELSKQHGRISELEQQPCPNCDMLEKEVERLRESEKFFADRCGDAELKLLELRAKLERFRKDSAAAFGWKK